MRKYTPCLIISSVILAVYFRSLFFGFTYLDDNALILDNIHWLQNLGNIGAAFGQQVFRLPGAGAFYYRPLLTVSFMIDAVFSGINPLVYHFSNVVYHAITSGLVFLLLKKLKYSEKLSLIFALIFAVHPVLTQAVSWIPGRNDSLLAIFILAALITFLERKYYWHLVFFAAAIFTKETALFLPVVLGAYDFLISKEFKKDLQNKVLIGGWVGILGWWFLLRQNALASGGALGISTMIYSVFSNLLAVVLYIGKIIFPYNLSVLPILPDSTLIPGFIALGLILILIFLKKKPRRNYILFGVFWFLVFLLPSFIRPNTVGIPDFIDHRVYLPMIGVLIIFLEVVSLPDLVWGITIVCLAAVTFWYSGTFSDRLTFWQDAVANSPHLPLAHRNLGAMYYLDNDFSLAKDQFEITLKLNPTEPMVHNNLGLIYMNTGQYATAEAEFKAELSFYPSYDNAYFNLGLLYFKMKKYDQAVAAWQKAVAINSQNTAALYDLAAYYQQVGDTAKLNYYLDQLRALGYTNN